MDMQNEATDQATLDALRAENTELRRALADTPDHADMDAAIFEANRLRAENARLRSELGMRQREYAESITLSLSETDAARENVQELNEDLSGFEFDIDALRTELAAANERIAELERYHGGTDFILYDILSFLRWPDNTDDVKVGRDKLSNLIRDRALAPELAPLESSRLAFGAACAREAQRELSVLAGGTWDLTETDTGRHIVADTSIISSTLGSNRIDPLAIARRVLDAAEAQMTGAEAGDSEGGER